MSDPTNTPPETQATSTTPPETSPETSPDTAPVTETQTPAAEPTLEERVIAALQTVFDPEIPVNIYELGLIYDVSIDEELRNVRVSMTLTSPACPVAGTLPGEVENRIRELDDVDDVFVELVWDPPWTLDRLTDAARLELGLT